MRVLVTGDRGYIGQVLVPCSGAAGHEVVGLDAGWYDGCDFGPAVDGYEQRVGDIRDVDPHRPRGFDAVVHLAAISNDPVGPPQPRRDLLGQRPRRRVHWPEPRRRPASAVPLLLLVLALRCGRRRPGRRGVAVQPGDALRREQGAGRERPVGRWPTTTSARPTCATRRLRLVAPAAGRHRRQQPHRHGVHPGEVRLQSDGSPWRPLVHAEDIAAPFLAVLEAPREVVHDQAFNVGRDEDVVQIRDIATLVADALDARSPSPQGRPGQA